MVIKKLDEIVGSTKEPEYADSVFINCPFDADYKTIFRGIIFTIYLSGFCPRCAMEEDNALQIRLIKILTIIEECKYGLHDISRTESNVSGYPRFNMPFELGLFYACMHYGVETQKTKTAVIFEGTKFSYLQTISDLNGVDVKSHNNEIGTLIEKLRNWLSTTSGRKNIPGPKTIVTYFYRFERQLPGILRKLGFDKESVPFNDLCEIIQSWLNPNLAAG